MGLHPFSPLSLLLILAIVIVLFGTNRLKNIGTDLGEMVRNFRKGFDGDSEQQKDQNKKSD